MTTGSIGPRVLVVGAGAVGGYLAFQLLQAGVDVTVLARGRRLEQVRTEGLLLRAEDGTERRALVDVVDAAGVQPVEIVIVTVKANALELAMKDFAAAVGPDTTIVPTQNGIRHLELLAAQFGADRVVGAVCLMATKLDDDGGISQVGPVAALRVGELSGLLTDRIIDLARLLDPAELDTSVSAAILQDMWDKWLLMATGSAATVLLGGPAGLVTSVEGGYESVQRLIDESRSILAAAGFAASPAALDRINTSLLAGGSSFTTSMYRDLRDGRVTEVEPVLGDFVREGDRLQVDIPLLRAAAVRVRMG